MRSSSLFKNKMRSESGATLMTALLFFIMCAVCGSVILAAASAAAGRMSRQQSSDQAYYTVTSAAKLLRDEIDGETVTVRKVVESTTGSDGTESTGDASYTYAPDATPGNTLMETAVQHFIEASDTAASDTAVFTRELTFTPDTAMLSAGSTVQAALSNANLKAYALFSMDDRYNVQIVISDKAIAAADGKVDTTSLAADQYYVILKLASDKQETEDTDVTEEKDTDGNVTSTKTTVTTTTVLAWKGAVIEKYHG